MLKKLPTKAHKNLKTLGCTKHILAMIIHVIYLNLLLHDDLLGDFVLDKHKMTSYKVQKIEDILQRCLTILINKNMPNYLIINRFTLLYLVVFFNKPELVEVLLKHPKTNPITRVCINHHTPFLIAVALGHLDIVKLFMRYVKVDLEKQFDSLLHTPLSLSRACENKKVEEYLKQCI